MNKPASSLRIIGGSHRSRRIYFDDHGVRPTLDRVRQTAFDWLSPHLEGASVLDLFAGTGAMGFEAASRGAHSVQAIENNRAAFSDLHTNINNLKLPVEAHCLDALAYLKQAASQPMRFDVVFLDPPFDADLYAPVLALLPSVLTLQAWVYVEGRSLINPPPAGFRWHRQKQAGTIAFGLLHYQASLQGKEP
jgi:16S rRNA (guanine966-N2)-methyltransferase